MTRSRLPFAGRTETVGYLIDPAHTGHVEARRRVADAWVPGARLLQFGERLLLLLPHSTSVRTEKAPGLAIIADEDRLLLRQDGEDRALSQDGLANVDLLEILDLANVSVSELRPFAGADPVPTRLVQPPPVPPAPTLRDRAGVRRVDDKLGRKADKVARELRGEGRTGSGPGRGGRGSQGGTTPKLPRGKKRVRSNPVMRRRHARYLEQLTENFAAKKWDDALRTAISLGGTGLGGWTARLPGRRTGALRPGRVPGAGGSIPYGESVQGHLRSLYQEAANQLERDGRYIEAAFVHADLLDTPAAAVELLERHGLYREGAELAEIRELDPSLVVRLWWRAGNRPRALEVARTRGAFAAALVRLDKEDPAEALALRREWVEDRRAAADHLGAVSAAWPEPELRDDVLPDIAAGMHAGGAVAGELLAHALEQAPSDANVDRARSVLAAGAELGAEREALVRALSTHVVGEQKADRELTSLAIGALLRQDVDMPFGSLPDVSARLQRRADPLLVADLPRLRPRSRETDATLNLDLATSGTMEVFQAVAVSSTSILIALGELGVQLLTLDGRVKARWDIPTHHLVVADHGGRVLLVTDRGSCQLVHQLDLPYGKPVPLPPLDVRPLESYDGTRPILVSERGLEWVQPRNEAWEVVWRELNERPPAVHHIARDVDNLAVLFSDGQVNGWHWALPSLRLQSRSVHEPAMAMEITAQGEVARLHQQSGVATLDWHGPYGNRLTTETYYPNGIMHLAVTGSVYGVADVDTEQGVSLDVHGGTREGKIATVRLPANAGLIFRQHQGRVTVGHQQGRIAVIDSAQRVILTELTLHV